MTETNLQQSVAVGRPSKQIVEFDPRGAESITARMATAVAEATDRDVTEVSPLGEWVDCDAIEQLFSSHDPGNELSLSFQFEDCEVFVSNIGRIVVTPTGEYENV
ncbi:HalOD1 output domain-containing protein [Halorubellus sp. PRR65]|uniref:HalOD1 output domain-containing protein n=1 Tax=Halorubellus sp. PRR65 TaxID=3098148 RepID=UPI002B25C15F|nr:HalOD1 output domain-containing protein [Halorubellus sp. PRR65]